MKRLILIALVGLVGPSHERATAQGEERAIAPTQTDVTEPGVEEDLFETAQAKLLVRTPQGETHPVQVTGETRIHVFFEGDQEGVASDDDNDGLDDVEAEVVSLVMTGYDLVFGPVRVTLNPQIRSSGEIEEEENATPGRLDVPPFTNSGTATSFFEISFQLELQGRSLNSGRPVRLESVIAHKPPQRAIYKSSGDPIPLLGPENEQSGFQVVDVVHTPSPVVERDAFPYTRAQLALIDPNGQAEELTLVGPARVNVYFEGEEEGDANDDNDDGMDEVQTELVELNLKGRSEKLGALNLRIGDLGPSVGQIVEDENLESGRLDLPPFAESGTAQSFFDVFFEVEAEIEGEVRQFVATRPKRMEAEIAHKPPREAIYLSPGEPIVLRDLNGEDTGWRIASVEHDPNPPIEVDEFDLSQARVELTDPDGQTHITRLTGPTTVNVFFEGEEEGTAFDDDQNGLEEVQTEMVGLDLEGNAAVAPRVVQNQTDGQSGLPVRVRLDPSRPSRGIIEEEANNVDGLLDVPPFTDEGQAASFFDVFFEVEVSGIKLHTAEP